MTGRKDCVCPRARHTHGTVGAYNLDACRCFACRLARSRATEAYNAGGGVTEYFVDPTGTRRRLEALSAIGVSNAVIGQHMGVTKDAVSKVRRLSTKVTVTTAARIAAAYDALWDKPGVGKHADDLRNRAARLGYHPPLAWDDDEIDDPAATPHTPGNGTWDRQPCGTPAAYRRHLRHGEPLDEACRNANRRDTAERKGAA